MMQWQVYSNHKHDDYVSSFIL